MKTWFTLQYNTITQISIIDENGIVNQGLCMLSVATIKSKEL